MFENLMATIAAFFAPVPNVEEAKLREIIDNLPGDSVESLQAQVRLLQLNAIKASAPKVKRLHVSGIKVSEKGGINFFGMRRFPVNLYLAELEALLTCAQDGTLEAFLTANRDKLSLSKATEESK
jgi:hypothetical protein